jgi:CPA1 family monovalent cation:H+ antiporter
MHPEIAFVALFSIATAVALVARWLKVPYTVALVVAGLGLGAAHAFEPPHLTKELLYAVFLPGLIFEAAFALEFKHFWHNKLAIFSLAIPGLIAAIALTAVTLIPVANGLHFVDEFTVADGLIFASVIAATDPIAVVGLFKSLGAPKRLGVLVEGESLLNDGTAVVVFTLVMAFVGGRAFSAPVAILDFTRVVGMGVLIGATIGYAVSVVIHRVDDAMLEITLTTIAAYGSFVAAEHFHYSGVIATVTAGMLCGNHAARTGMSPSTRVAVATFWEYLAFALNSIVFLLIGFEVRVEALAAAWVPIVVAYLCVTAGRAVVIFAVAALLRPTRERMPFSWATVQVWGGLRGSLSMVLVLGLPTDFAHRDLLVAMTFGVVILSILVQGVTMSPLLKRFGLVAHSKAMDAYDRLRASLKASRAALEEIARMEQEAAAGSDTLVELRATYEARIVSAEEQIRALRTEAEELREADRRSAERRAIVAEKAALLAAQRTGQIGHEAYDALASDVDARLDELGGVHEH